MDWFADVAHGFDDVCVAIGDRRFNGRYLDGCPAMVAMRVLRPVLRGVVVEPFLDNHGVAVRDTASAAAAVFAGHPAGPRRDGLAVSC
ncbi:hypothetical protein [Kitasatospora griseola]|uniref:hypothetical protein n=1 Tax=Kitasatospora griseola TaxID=2064 RepID=UPI00380A0E9F